MAFLQGRTCAIEGCNNDPTEVDHCHTTGKVRAMLCRDCNTDLAVLEKDLFADYIKYLHNHHVLQK